MKLFRIAIEETIVDEFILEANNEDDAIEIAIQKYKEGEFILEPGNLIVKQMAVVDNTTPTEWFAF